MTFHRTRLSALMFVQYFIWGVWWVPLGSYLNQLGFDAIIGQTYALQGWAAFIAPLVIVPLIGRWVRTRLLIATLHFLGAVCLVGIAVLGVTPVRLMALVLIYLCLYIPSLPLVTAFVLSHLEGDLDGFPRVRLFGTIGWIASGVLVGWLAAELTVIPMFLAAGASVLAAVFCFLLLSDPPAKAGQERTVPDLGFLRGQSWSFWVFVFGTLAISVPLSFYYAYANLFLIESGVPAAAAVQSLGQVSEIGFLILMPWFLRRFGMKAVLLMGMLAWTARYLAFAYAGQVGASAMMLLLTGILLHGICYDFFFVAGQIFMDRIVRPSQRNAAQSFLTILTLGIGSIIGSYLANAVYTSATSLSGLHNWMIIWLFPAILAGIVGLIFWILFRDETEPVRDPAE